MHRFLLLLLLPHTVLLTSVAYNAADDASDAQELEYQEKIQDLRNTKVWATLMGSVDGKCRDLLDSPSFSLADVQFMSSLPRSCLMSLSTSVASMMQETVEKSLTEELTKFYTENQPDKDKAPSSVHVAKLVKKYGKNTKQKKRLYDKLNKKYPGKVSTALKKMLVLKQEEVKVTKNAESALGNVLKGVQSPLDMVRNLAGISAECMGQLRASKDERFYTFSAECRAELTRAEEMIGESVNGQPDL